VRRYDSIVTIYYIKLLVLRYWKKNIGFKILINKFILEYIKLMQWLKGSDTKFTLEREV